MAEDAWNSRDPQRVSQVYSLDTRWRNRSESVQGRDAVVAFLSRKWAKELDYRLIKELWAWHDDRLAVRSPMNGMTTAATGFAATAMKTGASALTA